MPQNRQPLFVLLLSILLAVCVLLVSCTGILMPDFYHREAPAWQIESIGQDWFDLVIVVPALIITSFLYYLKRKLAGYLWAGVLSYLLYTFIIYCFALHFNQLFLLYCSCLGLSFYLLLWLLYSQLKYPIPLVTKNTKPFTITGIFFLFVSIAFYFLWLNEIVPSILYDRVPVAVEQYGLLVNPVHVIDLSVFLPAILVSGVLLVRHKNVGIKIAIPLLVFFILMNGTIGWLAISKSIHHIGNGIPVAFAMFILAAISVLLLFWINRAVYLKKD